MKRVQLAAIAGLGYPLLRGLGATYRWRVSGAEHLQAVRTSGKQPILAVWHGRILPGILHFQRQDVVAVTSENYDGEWISRIIHRFGYGTSRGSSSRGGARALRQMVRDVASSAVVFTLDGPRGPAGVAQPGAVWLAQATGNPLVPFHCEAASHWTLGSWDRTQIPKPFTTVALAVGEPLFVPRGADEPDLEQWRVRLEASLESCRAECLRLLAQEPKA